MALTRIFSELVFGTQWKERQKYCHGEEGNIIIGPDVLFLLFLSILFVAISFFFFYFDGPDGIENYFGNWRYILMGIVLFGFSLNKAVLGSRPTSPNTTYWIDFSAYLLVFMSGALMGAVLFDRLG